MDIPALSLCMIVRNEERSLAQCLDSARSLAAELIVADTGSTDRTPEIALQYGANVLSIDFTRIDFAAARNRTLSSARGRWVLVLDADERLDPSSVQPVRHLIAGNENAGYYFERLNAQPDSAPPTRDYLVRLFPNRPDYRYRGRVHETIDAAILAGRGRLLRSEIRIHHDFASDPDTRRRRNHLYIDILNQEIAADPHDSTRLDFLAAEYHQLGMFAEASDIAERIARLRPQDPTAHLHAGVYHLLFKTDYRQARADFLTALRLRPQYPEALSFLARLDAEEDA